MQTCLTLLFAIALFSVNAQKKHDVRRTIGLNFPLSQTSNEKPFYQEKFGFIYRQCFGKLTLQTELYRMWQHAGYTSHYTQDPFEESVIYFEHYHLQKKKMNYAQITLLKGWTNDITNLYVGAGLATGIIKEKGYYSKRYDSPFEDNNIIESWSPRYISIALTCSAAMEFRITKSLSGVLKFNPMFSWNYRLSKDHEKYENLQKIYPNHYKQMTQSGFEISLNYKL